MLLFKQFLTFALVWGPAAANFNLYLTYEEVKRILGLQAELFYVREGVVNDYAMSWTVPVPVDVHALHFTWQALSKKPVLYNMAISTNDTGVPPGPPSMHTPGVNISLAGTIPVDAAETFRLALPCTGTRSAEVIVTLNINVTSSRPKQPPVVLYFVRKKICLEGHSSEMFAPHQDPKEDDTPAMDTEEALPIVYHIVSPVVGLILVITIIALVALYRRRRLKKTRNHVYLTEGEFGGKCRPNTGSTLLRNETPNNNTYTLPSSFSINSYASLHKISTHLTPYASTVAPSFLPGTVGGGLSHASTPGEECDLSRESGSRDTCQSSSSQSRSELIVDPSTAEVHERFRQFEIERKRMRLTAVAQEGKYAKVYQGWIQRDKPEQDQQVLVKTVREGAPHEEVLALCRDGTQLFNLYHRNVLTMLAISFADNAPPFLIFPYHGYHNLKIFLQTHAGGHLRAKELADLSLQTAQGLSFLHSANVLHTDVAARNCVLSDKLQLRITDTALSKDLFPKDYEAVNSSTPRPMKWQSYETITDRVISCASDVWSYGVLLWELTTLGQQPYVEVAPCEMAEYLREGYRLAQPLNCPDELYKVMAFCWAIHPQERPTTKSIIDFLDSFNQQLNNFV